jgi:hypothetical protein
MLPRPRFLRKWRASKKAPVLEEKKAAGKTQNEYPSASADETTIADSRQDSNSDGRCGDGDTAFKNAVIIENLRILIGEAKAAIQIIDAKTAPAGGDGDEKDNNDVKNLNTLIEDAQSVIENLDSKMANAGMELSVCELVVEAQSLIAQVMSDAAAATIVVDSDNFTEEGTGSKTGVKAPSHMVHPTRVQVMSDITAITVLDSDNFTEDGAKTGVKDVFQGGLMSDVAVTAVAESDNFTEDGAKSGVKGASQIDDRNFLVFMADMVEEIGDMLAQDSAKLADRTSVTHCWFGSVNNSEK